MSDILALFDAEVRKGAPAPGPGYRLEWDGGVLRLVGPTPAAFDNCILYARLGEPEAAAAVARQREVFRTLGHACEWKLYGHDAPACLPALLTAAGFLAEEPEAVMVFDLARELPAAAAPGIEVRRLGAAELADYRRVKEEVDGGDEGAFIAAIAAEMTAQPDTVAVYVAYDGAKPVSASRLVAAPGAAFASMWGGSTLPAYRGRGIYRALVGARAAEAKRRGARYLTLDALPTSRPIVERLGFWRLTTTTPYVFTP